MSLVPLFDLKFLTEFAAGAVGTSNRRHEADAGTRNREVQAGEHFLITEQGAVRLGERGITPLATQS